MAYVISDECVACGSCAEGCPAEAISEGDGKYVIDPDTFSSKGRFTPFEGRKVFGRCIATYVDGNPVF